MSENPSPTAKPEPNSEPIEFNFEKPGSDIPRMKRRSLRAKPSTPQAATPPASRELEREAPPLSTAEATKPSQPTSKAAETSPVRPEPAPQTTPVAPPKTTPANTSVSSSSGQKPSNVEGDKPATANDNGITPSASGQKVNIALTSHQKATAAVLAASEARSPHGTRPATLYYTSQPKKDATSSMKPNSTATSATPASSSTRPATASSTTTSATRPASAATSATTATRPASASTSAASATAARPATATVAPTTATRPSGGGFDYRANVERQSREQKSVGSILSYFVYGLIAVFVIGAGLATYGTVVIFGQLHDHATSISGLDAKYAQKDAELTKAIVTTQDTLTQANATIAQQRDLLTKQEEEISQLHAAITSASGASADAIHAEARTRANETAALKARIRDLEYKTSVQNGPTGR